jgi:hypothetical protein
MTKPYELLINFKELFRASSYDGKGVMPVVQSGAYAVADAVTNMLVARAELTFAKENVPDYTGQLGDDYYRDQQATYNEACNDLLAALKSALT